MRKLYEINEDIERLLDQDSLIQLGEGAVADTTTGEVFNLTERLENLQLEKTQKIEGVALYLDDVLTKTEQITKKIAYLEGLKESMEKQVNRLHNYLLYATDKKGFEGKNVTIKVKKNPDKTIIEDEALIPAEFIKITKKTVVTAKPDIVAIKKAIQEGKSVPGAYVTNTYNITIQ